MRAAGVNPLDVKIRDGEFKQILTYQPPFVLGHDVAGVVVQVGSAVRSFAVGDEVYGRPRDHRIGTFAERIAVHEDDLAPKPSTLTMEEAASLPLVALTAWQRIQLLAGYDRRRVGLNHLAFYGRSAEQVDELTRSLRERGSRVLYEDRHPHAGGAGTYAVFFEDPDRIKVELVAGAPRTDDPPPGDDDDQGPPTPPRPYLPKGA